MKKLIFNSLFLLVATFFLLSCNNSKMEEKIADETKHEKSHEKPKDCTDVHWSYEAGEHSPENWQNLCDGYSACGGKAQSPINILTTETFSEPTLTQLTVNYESTPVNIINNGHTVQFNVSGNNTITLEGKEYRLLQFHYHAESEHTIDGDHYPLEVHFVNQYSESDYSVIGVMIDEGKSNELFSEYLPNFPVSKGEFKSDKVINLKKLLPKNLNYYHYNGSLTTPPCSEIVNWYVLKNPVEASKEQIAKFSEILHGNFRPVLPLNGRKVFEYKK